MATQDTFADRLSQVELTETPTVQPLAQGLGATPQQTAMTGTKAQIQSTIADRIAGSTQAQQQELSRAQRLTPKEREATVEESLDIERQEQLARLGNIGQSIQNTIQQNLAAVAQQQAGQRQVEGSILSQTLGLQGAEAELAKADPNSNYNRITNVLNQYLASGDPNDLESAMATIDNLKVFGLSSADAKRLVGLTQETIAKQTGQQVAENVLDQVTIKDLDLQALGFEQGADQVAQTLGVDAAELADMSIDQFSDFIQDKQKEEFSRVEGLKAELAAAPLGSLKREVLLRELRDLGQVGITGVEAETAETVEDIDLAGVVKVGDETMKVSEFLDDENLSDMISDWINEDDPARKDDIIPEEQFPELTAWIRSNQMALAQLSNTADDTKAKFDQANQDYKALNKFSDIDAGVNADVMKSFMPDWEPGKKVTSTELAEAKAKFGASALGQLTASPNIERTEKREIVNKLNMLTPDTLEAVKGMPLNDIRIASSAADELKSNPDLGRFLGVESRDGLVLDDTAQERIADYADVVEKISRSKPNWLTSQGPILQTIKGFSPEVLNIMADNPERFEQLQDYTNKREEIKSAVDTNSKLKLVFGQDLDYNELKEIEQDIHKWEMLGDPEARKRMSEWKQLFDLPPNVSRISEVDINNLANKVSQDYNLSGEDVIRGKYNPTLTADKIKAFRNRSTVSGPSGQFKQYENFINDGVVRPQDLASMTPAQEAQFGKWVDRQSGIKVDLNGFDNYEDFVNDKNEQVFMARTDDIAERSGLGSLDKFAQWADRVKAPGGWLDKKDMSKLKTFSSRLEMAANTAASDLQRDLYLEVAKDVDALMSMEQELLDRRREQQDIASRIRRVSPGSVDLRPTFTGALPTEDELDPDRQQVVLGGPSFPFAR
jgi:hypothetical protein